MRKLLTAATLVLAMSAFASPTLFARYEAVRQGLLGNSLDKVQAAAKQLAADARTVKQAEVAKLADAVAKSGDLAKARTAFGPLSDEMIRLREKASGARPAVYGCPMVNKSWLQEKGKVGNPYDPSMQSCGALKTE